MTISKRLAKELSVNCRNCATPKSADCRSGKCHGAITGTQGQQATVFTLGLTSFCHTSLQKYD
jgi:hypothetical protein